MSDGDRLAELAKRRGFYFQSSEPYGGAAGFYTFGPQGAAVKHNVEDAWRERFTVREGNMEIQSPTVMPEPVFEASGHLDTFDDMIVECADCGSSHRADHLVEDHTDIEEAESLPGSEVEDLIADNDVACPTCGTELAGRPVEDFNLMFQTNIGPGDAQPGYLRPETAQGIFVDVPRLKEYARNQLPFGVTQIGPAYRNEISPRGGLKRLREFTQAELELFVDPQEDEPPLAEVADVVLPLYSAEQQQAEDGEIQELTVREAVDEGVVGEPWIAYYLGVGRQWYERIGVDLDRFRYRQHLSGERAHYASDCWDAEADVSLPGEDPDWIEITGYAYRSDYDLKKHADHADDEFSVFKQYDEPVTVERPTVDPDMSYLGPAFGGQAQAVVDALADLAANQPDAFEGDEVTVEVDGENVTVPVEKTGFAVEEQTEHGEHLTPHVVEPSFGVDRVVYTVLTHAYREDEVDGEPRTYLALDPEVAPTTVGVFPLLDDLEGRARDLTERLRANGLPATYDDSGSIGRRYRRQDEIGTPFCVTLDERTPEDDTVTIRDRDTTDQVRVPVDELPAVLADLRAGRRSFEDLETPPRA
ncbi:glycine--tRNA ligase [Halobacteriales archaeon QS_1_68_20]|nr:MAG: glycine--tRNA ligase [Halobacteriales archaeon QS_1_68_20]